MTGTKTARLVANLGTMSAAQYIAQEAAKGHSVVKSGKSGKFYSVARFKVGKSKKG